MPQSGLTCPDTAFLPRCRGHVQGVADEASAGPAVSCPTPRPCSTGRRGRSLERRLPPGRTPTALPPPRHQRALRRIIPRARRRCWQRRRALAYGGRTGRHAPRAARRELFSQRNWIAPGSAEACGPAPIPPFSEAGMNQWDRHQLSTPGASANRDYPHLP